MRLRCGKSCAHFGIGDQIEPALAVAQLFVGKAACLSARGRSVLQKKRHRFGKEGQFAFIGVEEMPFDADDVAEVDFLFDEFHRR